jgi:hypothetical protein
VLCLGTDYAAGGYELDRAIPAYPSGPMDRHLYPVAVGQPFRSREQPPLLMFKVFPTEPLPAGRDSTKR